MTTDASWRCDGCGQLASPEHIARRLQRLEWATRYRPIHIGALLLGAVAPAKESDFLYAPTGEFSGEAALVLNARGIEVSGKSREAVLAEFQRNGSFLVHALECPLDAVYSDDAQIEVLLQGRLPSVMARIRRSLKPKNLVPISRSLGGALQRFKPEELGCAVILDSGRAFGLDGERPAEAADRLRDSVASTFASR